DTLWGLLINAGYLTVTEVIDDNYMTVRIPNGEVRREFQTIISERAHFKNRDLDDMFGFLLAKDLDGFMKIYRKLVLGCTSYHDAKENAYHMLFLGMSFMLRELYKITSNIESGHGRSDITMESLDSAARPHIIIEFKQGADVEKLKTEALDQIIENEYHAGLAGEVLCIGIAHDIKKCELVHKTVKKP
ncbi:MAG: PD-(D/E)XK nuclease domain-containing protein, partial [Lachnospiraceae bacterium]|nr:PD-(D/E)XK nuclease domain-containing protein [Lachnospiraceae bacterium]